MCMISTRSPKKPPQFSLKLDVPLTVTHTAVNLARKGGIPVYRARRCVNPSIFLALFYFSPSFFLLSSLFCLFLFALLFLIFLLLLPLFYLEAMAGGQNYRQLP